MNQATDIADFNLEFAHTPLHGENFDKAAVIKSAELARRELRSIEHEGASCAVTILIDDKHVKSTLSYKDVTPFLNFVTKHFPRIDYISFEKNLSRHKDKVIEQLELGQRDHVAGSIWRYQRKHRKLGCSHDIAIWHMIRLGLINGIEAGTIVPFGANAHSPPFVAHKLISILSEKDEPFERKAYQDILCHCINKKAVSRIQRVYYK